MNKKDAGRRQGLSGRVNRLPAGPMQPTESADQTLARLQRELAEARHALESAPPIDLLEANEQLVLSAMRAQADADAATLALNETQRMAGLDALTGLPNRVLLLDRFEHAIANAKRRSARLAVLFLDLNNFKQINDSFGHGIGDQVLKYAANCLKSSVRDADTVARIGGDEFVVLLDEVRQPEDVTRVVDQLNAELAVPVQFGAHLLRLGASTGISFFPEDGEDASLLIDRADKAMYRAKKLAHGGHTLQATGSQSGLNLGPAALESLERPKSRYEMALAAHERQYAELRERNEGVLVLALGERKLLTAARRALRDHDMLRGRLLSPLLYHPLAPIRDAARLLERMHAVQVAHLTRFMDALPGKGRRGSGALKFRRQAVDLTLSILSAIEACRPAVEMRLQTLTVEVPQAVIEVLGDATLLVLILRNLLDNASRYTQQGGAIHVSMARLGDTVQVRVRENGCGISAEDLALVFNPFTHDMRSMGTDADGLGIGLTVVRELVRAQGGEVVARSAGRGSGSEFVVTFPVPRGTPYASGEAATAPHCAALPT